MKILFTGGSSFTGCWLIRELARAGHDLTAVFRRAADSYPEPLRQERVKLACECCRPAFGVSFGSEAFLALIAEGGWDVLCHHAAEVTNYKSPDFNVTAALANNTHNLQQVLAALKHCGCRRIALSGSVFEGGEGAGSEDLPDFSPYGLSKALTARVLRDACARSGIGLGKFVIPNPFGPLEEPRFTAYLMKSWLAGATASCSSPAYIRDNIPVSLLAKAYAPFVAALPEAGFVRMNPSGYAESQGAFTERVAREMRPRLELPCPVELKRQVDFSEPRVRVNTDFPDVHALLWDEAAAWDEFAGYYERLHVK
jgi:nucleoside-diphosphate-sugar epimerase